MQYTVGAGRGRDAVAGARDGSRRPGVGSSTHSRPAGRRPDVAREDGDAASGGRAPDAGVRRDPSPRRGRLIAARAREELVRARGSPSRPVRPQSGAVRPARDPIARPRCRGFGRCGTRAHSAAGSARRSRRRSGPASPRSRTPAGGRVRGGDAGGPACVPGARGPIPGRTGRRRRTRTAWRTRRVRGRRTGRPSRHADAGLRSRRRPATGCILRGPCPPRVASAVATRHRRSTGARRSSTPGSAVATSVAVRSTRRSRSPATRAAGRPTTRRRRRSPVRKFRKYLQ